MLDSTAFTKDTGQGASLAETSSDVNVQKHRRGPITELRPEDNVLPARRPDVGNSTLED
jgi:hypothetical protein